MLELGSTISSSLDETDKELLSHGFKAFLPTADKSTADKSEENGDNSKEGVCTYRGTQLFSARYPYFPPFGARPVKVTTYLK